jgi:tRNA1Val (adenine37-N6)-methyltransferase
MEDYFRFKHFTIYQGGNIGLKVNTDSVLLGAWTKTNNTQNILDIGTGNGILALMMAQKSKAQITAIEINYESCLIAVKNAIGSPWKERINIINCGFQDYYKNNSNKFDLIISNPPYFNNSLKNKSKEKLFARHTDLLSHNELIAGVSKLLTDDGNFCLILPIEEKESFVKECLFNKLYCTETVEIKPRLNLPPNRVLMKFSKKFNNLSNYSLSIKTINSERYTNEYKELTKNFYLNIK